MLVVCLHACVLRQSIHKQRLFPAGGVSCDMGLAPLISWGPRLVSLRVSMDQQCMTVDDVSIEEGVPVCVAHQQHCDMGDRVHVWCMLHTWHGVVVVCIGTR